MAEIASSSEIIQQVFPGILPNEAMEMANSGVARSYPGGTVLCQEGAIEGIFYIILDGKVQVTKLTHEGESRVLTNLGRGAFFGEMALIHNAPRAATVTTLIPTTVLEINKDNFDVLLGHNASMSLAMVREVSRRVRENDDLAIEDLRIKSQELAIAYQQLAEQNYAQQELLSSIAHDLRTPLMATNGYLQAMKMGMLHGEALSSALDTVSGNIQRIITLVNDILWLEEMDLILLEFQPVDLGSIVTAAFEQQRGKAVDSQVDLHLNIASSLPQTKGDARSLERVVNVLLENAIKFSPDGGDVRIDVGYDEKFVWVKVNDCGVGIPPEAMPRLFRRFFRLDEVNGHLFTGAGMGLSISRQVIEQHGGEIQVQSDLGKGSTFTIRLERL